MSLELLPPISAPPRLAARAWSPEEALVELVRGRLQAVGPITAAALATSLGLPVGKIESALYALEGEGFVMRGQFEKDRVGGNGINPGGNGTNLGGNGSTVQWCERRLLARVHRYTLERLRREIDPVPQADFMRFLFSWQRLEAEDKAEGPESLAALLQQLEGFETAAAAWEGEVLPVRLAGYDPVWLDALCLSGRIVWGRVAPPQRVDREPRGDGRRSGPVRATPIALLGRQSLPLWQELAPVAPPVDDLDLSGEARGVHDHLRDRGASFFAGIASGTGLLHTQVEEALAELVAQGLATADSFTGLRALLTPSNRRAPIERASGARPGGRRRGSVAVFGMENAGRWSLLGPEPILEPIVAASQGKIGRGGAAAAAPEISPEAVELVAWTLLRRYGVVFRRLVERETLLPPWRDLLRVFRRLEARGEIRGGRFVSGFSGEQYALPDAVGRLRAVRKRPQSGELVSVSAADPLNLVGIVTPGSRVSALAGNRILYRDGVPVAVHEGRETRFLVDLDPAAKWQAQTALVRRPVPPQLKSYLGKSA